MSLPRPRAAIVGVAELAPRKAAPLPDSGDLDMAIELMALSLADAGLEPGAIDGLCVASIRESAMFAPATVAEYLGLRLRFAEHVDLGGATAAGMVWRASAAIAAGAARAVLCLLPGNITARHPHADEISRFGGSSYRAGSPQAEFDICYGHVGQNALYAMFAQRYAHLHGYDDRALARLVVQQRRNAQAVPDAIFAGKPISEEEVLASPMVARPLRRLEIVMPVWGGAAVLVADADIARTGANTPVWITGHGEAVHAKSPHMLPDMLRLPLEDAARSAFAMAGMAPKAIDMAQLYDCYSVTVLLELEACGLCDRGQGMAFLRERDFGVLGDFPLNTNGGQLGFGQAGPAGGMTHVIEAVRQVGGRAPGRQIPRHQSALVVGTGGIMSEQVALILEGA